MNIYTQPEKTRSREMAIRDLVAVNHFLGELPEVSDVELVREEAR